MFLAVQTNEIRIFKKIFEKHAFILELSKLLVNENLPFRRRYRSRQRPPGY